MNHEIAVDAIDFQARIANGTQMLAARNERHVLGGSSKSPAKVTTDSTCAKNSYAHLDPSLAALYRAFLPD
jgi:hypothetical protein